MRKAGVVVAVLAAVSLGASPALARTHPASAARHVAAPRSAMRVPGMVKVPGIVNTQPLGLSLNWSGWADTSKLGAFNAVHGQFRQPAVRCDGKKNNWTSEWTGLDGFNSNTVEQDGTFAACLGPNHRKPVYFAWYEMFPAPSVNVFPVKPGDLIDSAVRFANGRFTLTISDVTRRKTATVSAACSECLRTSAEWIVERPALCNNSGTNCFITALANFGTARMQDAAAGIDGGQMKPISRFAHTPIDMVQPKQNGKLILLAHTSGLNRHDHSSSSFSVQWKARGGIFPITF
jgi:Peptidase A4 family